jgi:hypothetical protein
MRFFSAVFPGKNPAPALATQATRTRRWPLDLPLIKFSRHPNDIWRLSDAFQDVLIIGAKGSGKTSGSGKVFASKYLQAGFGGLQRESYLFGLLTLAEHHEAKHPEWPMIQNYWTREWAKLNPKTRDIIESDFTGSSSLWAPFLSILCYYADRCFPFSVTGGCSRWRCKRSGPGSRQLL